MRFVKTGFKSIVFLVIVLLLLMTANQDSYALFFTKYQEQLGVSSASAENLIKYVQIIEQEDKSLVIEIMRDSEYGYRPDVGFAIEGDISEYVLHINPVKVDQNGIYQIPIVPNINFHQYWELLFMKISQDKNTVSGSVAVKNFDGKVIDQKPIEINIDYLLSRIDEDIKNSEAEIKKMMNEDVAKMEVASLINRMASTMNWEEQMKGMNSSTSNYTLSSYQDSMIRAIAPNLMGHLKKLTEDNNELVSLKSKNASLQGDMERLEEENQKLRKRLEELEKTEANTPSQKASEEELSQTENEH
ncbi:hypothetical protein [Robertmurraya kyonggiensis]|uniref:Uncharacterized protein n=1 Tax=Robertmurraya kyonggiensis TaxID=1037680 RepID=A0A4U1DB45_9BACI|nr:hypothetical protein [Robertmurraya kyonggiensis]TKC19815.1 hypothetical protein FA727_09850 [Robertmurraya kyonggiensis]